MPTSNGKSEWMHNTLEPTLNRFPERQEKFITSSEIEVSSLYTPEDLDGFEYNQQDGYPGEFPYTRGAQPSMYRGRLWTMRQYAGYAGAEESNLRYRYLLEQGQTGLSVAFDLPTQIGYDSDNPLSEGEVGRVGVAIDSIEDVETLFKDIPLDRVSTSMTINATAPVLLAMYVVAARRQGVPLNAISGTIQNDVLKEYIARGTYIFPPKHAMRLVTDTFAYCVENLPKWNFINVSGYHIREAGSDAVQELAFTMANAVAYIRAALDSGIDIDKLGPQFAFFFVAHNNLFEEVAKFRAARRMWATLMRDHFKAKDPKSWVLRFHTQTAGSTLTAQQPENNVIRVTVQALAAVLGGTQSLHTCARDEALALPTEQSAQIALRTQQVLAYESGVADTVDPLAGSYYVEWLTNELESRAWKEFEKIDQLGGSLAAIEAGYMQREITESAFRFQRRIEQNEQTVVGVNRFAVSEKRSMQILRVDETVQARQIAKLVALRSQREAGAVSWSLGKLKQAAAGADNVMPAIVDCVEARATLGEICDVLREVFGEQTQSYV
ncbi:MAG: methylmalonyl-CoA mutase family protein [Chloroflexi bacterium]|nr:methylmalonyl-CoA mutase family protein [Chloroflexota bacterium]